MRQLGIKLPEKDMEFLEWYSKEYSTPKSVIYRDKTLMVFQDWKIHFLLELYLDGKLGFKKFCNLANISLIEGMKYVQQADREPFTPEMIDDYTSKVTEENIRKNDLMLYKNRKGIKRTK